jgi:hypothetical protein
MGGDFFLERRYLTLVGGFRAVAGNTAAAGTWLKAAMLNLDDAFDDRRPMPEGLENASFYHVVALPRHSRAACCPKPTFFCTAQDPCAIVFVEIIDSARHRPRRLLGATREISGFAKKLLQYQSQKG